MFMTSGSEQHHKLTAKEMIQAAQDLFENGEFTKAAELIEVGLKSGMNECHLWELKGLVHHSLGEAQESVNAIEYASLLAPLNPATRVCLSYGYANIGKPELSRDLLMRLIDDRSMTTELLLQVATGLDMMGLPNYAIKACRVIVQRDPLVAQAYYDMGYYTARCKIPRRITESLMRLAIHLEPDCAHFRVGLAALLFDLDRSVDAHDVIKDLSHKQIVRLNCLCCLKRIAELFESSGDFRRSALCQERLLALEINNSQSDCC